MENWNIALAFILTAIAGLSTGVGSLLALLAKRTNTSFLCASLGFSAGVMLYVSFMEMMPQANGELIAIFGEKQGTLYLILAFFGGIALINFI
ncbi:MAG: zinc transporter ZupT, partial [Prevotella sp.]|nr:zinc transporter ZupT [Prevotella sp.]